MEILWLAIVFYSLGLAAVLYWRPRSMFHSNGTWKEFGYQRDSRHTIFPFWLFAIAWAFVSYTVAAGIAWTIDSGVPMEAVSTATAVATASAISNTEPLHFTEEDLNTQPSFGSISSTPATATPSVPEEEATPVSRSRNNSSRKRTTAPKDKLRPGYYALDKTSPESGLKRYVYVGTTRP
jgi:hypothetical protein